MEITTRTMTITGHIHISSPDLVTITTQTIIMTHIGILTGGGIQVGILATVTTHGITHGTTLTGDIRHGIITVGTMVIGMATMMASGQEEEEIMTD